MKKILINDFYLQLLDEYGIRDSMVAVNQGELMLNAVLLNIPKTMIVGEPSAHLAMVRYGNGEKAALCFIEFESFLEGDSNPLSSLMQPGEIGWNRVMQKRWGLGFCTESVAVTGNFIGGYGCNHETAILPRGEFFCFYLEVLSMCAKESDFLPVAS